MNFDKKLKLEFHGSEITSDAGLLAYRELDNALGLTETVKDLLCDVRKGKNTQHSMLAMSSIRVWGLGGYEDLNDAERLRVDPTMRHVVDGRAIVKNAVSTNEMGRFETEILSQRENVKSLMSLPEKLVDKVHTRKRLNKLILDMNSSVSETHGQQQGSAYNGHFSCNCYHPLFLFNQYGDVEYAMLSTVQSIGVKFYSR